MVGLVIVSHSQAVALGTRDGSCRWHLSVPMNAAGGTADGRLAQMLCY